MQSIKRGDTARKTRKRRTGYKRKQSFFILFNLIYLFHPSFESKGPAPSPSQEVAKKGFLCLSPTQAIRQALFFVERIARLASYACRVGLGLPSSYVRLEWELHGFDGPISYFTACCTDGHAGKKARKQQEKDIVYLPPLP